MSLISFNHPLAAAPVASNAEPLPATATQQCGQLAALKAKSFDDLLALGYEAYTGHLDQFEFLVPSVLNDTKPSPAEHKLAEAIYFRMGHNLAMDYRIADMTRLQQEHETLQAGLFTREQIGAVSNFTLELQLRAWVNRENEERFAQMDRDDSGYPTISSSKSNSPSDDDDDNGSDPMYDGDDEDGEDDEDMEDEEDDSDNEVDYKKKQVYVTVWKRELNQFITYAY